MVMTVVEGNVAPESWLALEQAYQRSIAAGLPSQMRETFLVHSAADETRWQIVSIWHSREALEEMRRQGPPAAPLMFQEAGAEPTLAIFDVVASAMSEPGR